MSRTEKIKELREKAGITQAELARRLGVTRAAVLFMESPENFPMAWRLPEIADAIGCSIDALFGRSGTINFTPLPIQEQPSAPNFENAAAADSENAVDAFLKNFTE